MLRAPYKPLGASGLYAFSLRTLRLPAIHYNPPDNLNSLGHLTSQPRRVGYARMLPAGCQRGALTRAGHNPSRIERSAVTLFIYRTGSSYPLP